MNKALEQKLIGPMEESHTKCRGIVTSDVLVKGLSRGAIATRKLDGVN